MSASNNKNIPPLIIVVNGVRTEVTVNVQQKVKQLVREALHASGQPDASPEDWELKTEAGVLLNPDLQIGAAGIVAGTTLFLSQAAGGGG